MQLPQWIKRHQKGFFSPGYCALSLLPHEINIAYLLKNNDSLELQFCQSYPYEKITTLGLTLTQIVKENHLTAVACNWILTPHHYQIIMTEALPVTAAEFQEAIRWKIKDSLSYPVSDAIIDHFTMPEMNSSANHEKMAVVAAKKSYLDAHSQIIQKSGLKLTAIDIPELALRNLTALYENDAKTSAFIYLQRKESVINFTQQREIYFKRKLEFGFEHKNPALMSEEEFNQQIDKLSLDIQRSFDYYQMQWRRSVPARIFLATTEFSPDIIAKQLEKRLTLPVHAFDISEKVRCLVPIPIEQQGKYLPVLGGVLREMVPEYETTN